MGVLGVLPTKKDEECKTGVLPVKMGEMGMPGMLPTKEDSLSLGSLGRMYGPPIWSLF